MIIPEKLKLNKFRDVRIPSGQELINSYLGRELPANRFSGDETIFKGRKTEELQHTIDSFAEDSQND